MNMRRPSKCSHDRDVSFIVDAVRLIVCIRVMQTKHVGPKIENEVTTSGLARVDNAQSKKEMENVKIDGTSSDSVKSKFAFEVHRNVSVKHELGLILAKAHLVQSSSAEERKVYSFR